MGKGKLGLPSVIATGVGLIVATSCLMSVGQGAGSLGISFIISMVIACIINITTALCLSELNAIMPNLTGGLAQYTLASFGPFVSIITMVGGYLVCNTIAGSAECAMFGNTLTSVFNTKIPGSYFCIILLLLLIVANLHGIDLFAKIQNVVAYGLIFSIFIMGIMGALKLGTGEIVEQPLVLSSDLSDIFSMIGLAFFLFLGCEFIIPIAPNVKNQRRNVPLGMILSLIIVAAMEIMLIFGMHNYTDWTALAEDASPHVLYGISLFGDFGKYWMALISVFAVVSSVNSIISSLAYICAGMAKIGLMPKLFMKRNKNGAPFVGIFLIGGSMVLINATGLSTTSQLSLLILIGCVFWMAAYCVSSLNVLVFRKKMAKVPRTFKLSFGPVIPIVGIIGNIFMIFNIASDTQTKLIIYSTVIAIFAVLSVYAYIWVKKVMKRPLFKAFEIKEIMAMENDLYHVVRKEEKRTA